MKPADDRWHDDSVRIRSIEHPGGITEDWFSDGSKRFSCLGRCECHDDSKCPDGCQCPHVGVLWILPDGTAAETHALTTPNQRIEFLIIAARNMPSRPVEISDVGNNKEEARVLLEALRLADHTFFNALAAAINHRPSASERAMEKAARRADRDGEVIGALESAAAEANGCPTFENVFTHYQAIPEYRSHTRQQLKAKLKGRGFEWLCDITEPLETT